MATRRDRLASPSASFHALVSSSLVPLTCRQRYGHSTLVEWPTWLAHATLCVPRGDRFLAYEHAFSIWRIQHRTQANTSMPLIYTMWPGRNGITSLPCLAFWRSTCRAGRIRLESPH